MAIVWFQSSTSVIDDDLASSLLEESILTTCCTVDFATYVPGQLLREAASLKRSYAYKEFDNVSEVSTADTQNADMAPLLQESFEEDVLASVGSASHGRGMCSPCGFFHKGGCIQGAECKFCHLCPPGSVELKHNTQRKLVKASKRKLAKASS